MTGIQNYSRRGFLKGVLSGGAFVLGAYVAPSVVWASSGTRVPSIMRFFIRMYSLV